MAQGKLGPQEVHPNINVNAESKMKSQTLLYDFWMKFKKQKMAVVAGSFILLIIFIAIFGKFIAPYDPLTPDYNNVLSGPSLEHLAGTDPYGRDIFSRIIAGTRITLIVSFVSVLLGAIAGVVLGLVSGYYGGWLDKIIMRGSDVLFAFPDIILAIGIIAILGPGLINVVIAIAVYSVPSFARIIRGNTLSTKETVYVEATRSLGAKNRRIIWRHIFPDTISGTIVYFTMKIGTAILAASSLSFLGLGATPPTPVWGVMLSVGRNYLSTDPYIALFPGIAIFVTALAFNLLGDGLRDALDPKIEE